MATLESSAVFEAIKPSVTSNDTRTSVLCTCSKCGAQSDIKKESSRRLMAIDALIKDVRG